MERYSIQQSVEIVKIYYQNGSSVRPYYSPYYTKAYQPTTSLMYIFVVAHRSEQICTGMIHRQFDNFTALAVSETLILFSGCTSSPKKKAEL